MRQITNQEITRLIGFHGSAISNFVRDDEIRPNSMGKGGSGPGRSRTPSMWAPTQAIGLAVGRGLRLIGVSPNHTWCVVRSLAGMTEAKLMSEFSAGRTHIGIIGDWAFPDLVTEADALENKALTVKSLTVIGELPRAINVSRIWSNLVRAIDEIDRQKNPLLSQNEMHKECH